MNFLDYAAHNRIVFARVFGAAFVVALLLTAPAHGRLFSSVMMAIGLVLVSLATVGRLWCSLYINGYKDVELLTTGPYAITRNPLYFFSFLGFVGIGFATETLTYALLATVLFGLTYPAVIRREENFLIGKFGEPFRAYCASVPRFWPRFSKLQEPERWVVNPIRFRRTMGDVLWFVWAVGLIEIVHALHATGAIKPLLRLP